MNKKNHSNLSAGIIIIGDEILSGRTKDTNSHFISKHLIKAGIQLQEIGIIQDKEQEIINTVLKYKKKYHYVFTTGGIGPTHDDITSKSISKAFRKKFVFHPEAFKLLEKYYSKDGFNEGRQRMAKMPKGVSLIYNPLTIAPGFIIENVFVLPGVPKIMKKMFLEVLKYLDKGNPKKIVTINTNLYESNIAAFLKDIQNKYLESSIGSYPYFNFNSKKGGVNIVVSSWTMENLDNIVLDIENMIKLKGGKSSLV